MLLRFRVANYRSIRDRQEVTFVATRLNQGSAVELSVRPSGVERVLPVIAVYGANASGKSNVLNALGRIVPLVLSWDDRRPSTRFDPFLLDSESADAPTFVELEFVVDDVRYEYGVEFGEEDIVGEWLHAFPKGRRQVWFDRSGAEAIRFPGGYLRGATDTLAQLVRPDRSFLALGNAVSHPQLSPLAAWLQRIHISRSRTYAAAQYQRHARVLAALHGARLNELVARADIGIAGTQVVEVEEVVRGGSAALFEPEDAVPRRRKELRLVHRAVGSEVALPLDAESDGTISWLLMLDPLLRTLDDGGVLVVDELTASLHPTLAAEVIRMFQDPAVNLRGAQLLFSSHDATILGTQFGAPLLERDQIWFTEKGDDGATEVFSLADFAPRKGENVEHGYLAGRYGAAPDLSPGELARALKGRHEGQET